ncbi:MAG TPA: HDOD domain-containing protein [Candidatus Acidoferrum sp.]|jgi:EAL and modified HD-GYP domain-containing signal transduction protein
MHEKFIARQPILDTRLQVFAYELLFRGGPQNSFQPFANAASSVIADSITLFDLDMLTGHARAFVNVDETALRLGAPRLLPAERIVVEILETVRPTQEILGACRELRSAGYQLALDDFVDSPEIAPLVEFASFLKIDFQMFDGRARRALAQKYMDKDIRLLAEKVETESEFREARDLGFSYFQGYFFCKPAMVETREIPGNKAIQLQLLAAVAAPELRFDIIENLLKQEPSLLYRLLRYLNSPILGLRSEVRSVRHAIVLLGENEFRRWASIFAIISMSAGKSPELVRTALTRAFFCEEFAAAAGLREKGASLFLMGLLSVTDALLDKPMREVLKALPIIQEVKIALCGGTNRFRDVFELLLALERAEWIRLSDIAVRIGCDEAKIPDFYLSALLRATSIGA